MVEISIVAGLGNPGSRYEGTRHNAGFLIVDAAVQRLAGDSVTGGSQGGWREQEGALVCRRRIGSSEIIFVKPMSFMNRSGEPLSRIMRFLKISSNNLLVIHDEIDLPFGALRLKVGGGEGGHNGLKSISVECSSKNYTRLRVGVGKPVVSQMDVADWVLSRFSAEEQRVWPDIVSRSFDMLVCAANDGVAAAQAKYNGG